MKEEAVGTRTAAEDGARVQRMTRGIHGSHEKAGRAEPALGVSSKAPPTLAPAGLLIRLWRQRIVRFGAVATSCTLVQFLILASLTRLGVSKVIADGIGFGLSAQANFALSAHVTWRDRKPRPARHAPANLSARPGAWPMYWVKFNAVALVALVVNELAFTTTMHFGFPLFMAASAGIAGGTVLTFTLNNFVTFRAGAVRNGANVQVERRPGLEEIRAWAQREGVAFFLPAFNEAANLQNIVPRIIDYFLQLACPFTVIIVDDGSIRDYTSEVAESLASMHPAYVQAVHHPQNKGYGGALHSGIRAALETGHGLIAFCDADGQFEIESFSTLVAALQDQEADLSVGYRIVRADSLKRRLMGRAWHWLSCIALGFTAARDVDCGFKVFTRAVLEDVEPKISGDYAAVSPEILARAVSAGYTMSEVGVTHKPRIYGRQTGSDLRVVILSLVRLFQLRLALRQERRHGRRKNTPAALSERHDYTARGIALVSALLSVAAYVVTDRLGAVLLYLDAFAHMEKGRLVIASTTPGLAQLGDVWLPLPHLLMLPLVWDNLLYRNGFAGAIISMIAYVATAVLVYKITFRLTARKFAGVVAAAVFALNINMLYMQSTPMTEALLFCMLAAMVYCIQRWAETDQYKFLIAGGAAAFFGTLTRYESWPVLACLLAAVIFIAWQRKPDGLMPKLRWAAVLDRFIPFAVVATSGILGWVMWSWALFGSPVDFLNGPFAKPSLWVSKTDPTVGNWLVAAKTYWYAMLDNETWPLLLLAALGLICLITREWRTRRTAARSLPVLSLLGIAPFFIVSLYAGQRPLSVMQISHVLSNVRFGLVMLVPVAILVGYLVGALERFKPAMYVTGSLVLLLVPVLSVTLVRQHNVVTYNEARSKLYALPDQESVGAFLQRSYKGGRVLMESFGNEKIVFRVPSSQLVYEGSYRQWLPTLHNPAGSHIEWIIARCGYHPDPDKVCTMLGKAQLSHYATVYITPDHTYRVYRLRK